MGPGFSAPLCPRNPGKGARVPIKPLLRLTLTPLNESFWRISTQGFQRGIPLVAASGNQDRGTGELARPQALERRVRLREWKRRGVRAHRHARRECQELLGVAAGEIGDPADHPLLPQDAIGKGGNIPHVDPRADHPAPPVPGAPPPPPPRRPRGSGAGWARAPPPTGANARERACPRSPRGRVNANLLRPCHTATCATICAAAPKP